MWRPLIIAGAWPAVGAYCYHAQESPRPARPSLLSSPQVGPVTRNTVTIRMVPMLFTQENGGPACSTAPECRPLPERRPTLTPRVWSPKSHLKPPDHNSDSNTIGKHLQVFVRDNNVEQALRALKKKMQREGIFREMKRRKAYEKPSERRTREKAEAIRRVRKAARKQAQRDGLIPMPKPREDARRSVARPRSF
jgi:small subunit ribosomal protein S21